AAVGAAVPAVAAAVVPAAVVAAVVVEDATADPASRVEGSSAAVTAQLSDGPRHTRLEAAPARHACRSASSRGSRGRGAPGPRAGPRRRRGGASRTSAGGYAARR